MNTNAVRNSGLALVGLAALTIYILACTSFSPDDGKVLYPAFDTQNGALGIAVYDREAARSRMVFVPVNYSDTNLNGSIARAQWLGNGRRILLSWMGQNDDTVNLGVVPDGAEGAVRLFRLDAIDDATSSLIFPMAVSGQNAFVTSKHTVHRVDLATGQVVKHFLPTNLADVFLFSGPDENSLCYLAEAEDQQNVFGRFNPATFELTPWITITNNHGSDGGGFFAVDERGRRLAYVENKEEGQDLVVVEAGKPAFRKSIFTKEKLDFGNAVFLTRKNLLLASFMRESTNTSSFGVIEIPLKDGAVRETTLIREVPEHDTSASMYFQVGVSHDGRTAAAASTYLACTIDKFKAEDCALFFVDLNDPKRKVTKVPVPMPREPARTHKLF